MSNFVIVCLALGVAQAFGHQPTNGITFTAFMLAAITDLLRVAWHLTEKCK